MDALSGVLADQIEGACDAAFWRVPWVKSLDVSSQCSWRLEGAEFVFVNFCRQRTTPAKPTFPIRISIVSFVIGFCHLIQSYLTQWLNIFWLHLFKQVFSFHQNVIILADSRSSFFCHLKKFSHRICSFNTTALYNIGCLDQCVYINCDTLPSIILSISFIKHFIDYLPSLQQTKFCSSN